MQIINAKNLRKTYKTPIKEAGLRGALKHLVKPIYKLVDVVSELNLEINEGEAVAYLGPNGAGKSTTIKMLTGILMPSEGTVRVNGLDPFKNRIRNSRQIGVIFGQRTQLWWDLPLIESFTLMRDIYKLSEKVFKDNLHYFSELLDLKSFIHLPARSLSLGQKMRADIAISFMHNPKVVFLDEPTIGLDISIKERVQMFLKKINEDRKTSLILTSHDMNDIKNVCKRLVIIDKGRIIYNDQMDVLVNKHLKKKTIHFISTGSVGAVSDLNTKDFDIIKTDVNNFSVTFDRFKFTTYSMINMLSNHFEVVDFKIEEPDIENIIKLVYQGNLLF